MKIELVDGLYWARERSKDGTVCMGYSPVRSQAMEFCEELVIARDEK